MYRFEQDFLLIYIFCRSVKTALVNRISYWLKLVGVSHVVDTACSASMYGLEEAYRLLKENRCDYAIIGGSNICMNPAITLQFKRQLKINIPRIFLFLIPFNLLDWEFLAKTAFPKVSTTQLTVTFVPKVL